MPDAPEKQDDQEPQHYGTVDGFREWARSVETIGRIVEVEKRVRTGGVEITYRALVAKRD